MKKVRLYFIAGDPYCEMIRNLLKFHNVDFEMIEVSVNKEAKREMAELSGQENVPVICVDGRAFVGFDFEMLKKVLGLTGEEQQSKQ
ncbi:MAG: glutaredoxin family protein [Nanoarchaeota archaeon]